MALARCVGVPVEELLASTAIVVESGSGRIGEWREFRRNVLEDYRLVFGEEPWDIVAVGVMTDAGNSRQKARTQYGDITFRLAQ